MQIAIFSISLAIRYQGLTSEKLAPRKFSASCQRLKIKFKLETALDKKSLSMTSKTWSQVFF